ncbi:alpha/beta fold hydrolase [Bailinhaonella thermotolerans]|uniref:Alpha/beta hydrolase n=1 Tax=Bailinhaonella thermotolerans TaxID=1070861 RepID=A0A3A4BVH6_9ACTN|nr:alpha/beta hydrolase [Bailinhaonella thermotolerans]RJL35598.1 alpha/beta hydrolase [Bailinhaonella thermotolerans]
MRLHVREFDGPADRALLVIHGGPDWDHSYLVEPLRRLAGEYRLLFPDLRGCGRSAAAEPLTPDAMVGDLVELIGASRVDVLGFSYGGLIAQRLAIQAPHLVRRLIVASSAVLPVPEDAFEGWEEYERRKAAHPSSWDTSPLEGAELTWAEAFAAAPLNVWRKESLPEYLRRLEQVTFTGSYLRPWREGRLPSAQYPDAAERLSGMPLFLLHGRYDMTFPASLVPLTPCTDAVVLDEAGHMAHIDQPEAWLAAVTRFLAAS